MTLLLPSYFFLLTFQGSPTDQPIIVKIVEPKPTGLAEVFIGALGLSGVLFALSIVFAAVLAGGLFLLRSRNPLRHASERSEH